VDYPELTIIGERINPGFKSSLALFENSDFEGIRRLAVEQVDKGARYLNINTGQRTLDDTAFMGDVVRNVQEVVDAPLSLDFPNRAVQAACLAAYDPGRARGGKPIVNSINELRWDMADLGRDHPCRFLLMASERMEGGRSRVNRTAGEIHETAARMARQLMRDHGAVPDDLIIDVSVAPVAADTEGLTRMAVEAIRLIGADSELAGTHRSVGLSNISIMTPAKALDGSPLKLKLESAFLTLTVPHGLDMIIGTAGRDYRKLPDDDFVMTGFREALALDDVDAIMRIQELYQ
jgi:cobalamin-dependent methionine synthase I